MKQPGMQQQQQRMQPHVHSTISVMPTPSTLKQCSTLVCTALAMVIQHGTQSCPQPPFLLATFSLFKERLQSSMPPIVNKKKKMKAPSNDFVCLF
jgi:hypothetical protein